ncbi:tail assembly protein [Stenotrophomonas phage Suzuki]|nr:tail assembly protein [Stenotrophomonas phage Suzuki]
MGHAIGTVTGGSGDEAYYKVLAAIKTLAEANGWTTLRYIDAGANRELILNSKGLSGTEDIYIGFKTYFSTSGDYYNILVGVFTGYVSANSFETQPGGRLSGVPCHNNAVTYFMTANPQRIAGCFKVGTPVYTHFYAGKMFPYSRPGEFPSPLVCAGMFDGAAGKRFSDLDYGFPYHGRESGPSSPERPSLLWLRDQVGSWRRLSHFPFYNDTAGSNTSYGSNALANYNYLSTSENYRSLVPAGTNYQPQPIILYTTSNPSSGVYTGNVFGELDGVYQISGFNNNVENVVQVGGTPVDGTGMTVAEHVDAVLAAGGRAFVMLQDVGRTDWRSFIGLEMT